MNAPQLVEVSQPLVIQKVKGLKTSFSSFLSKSSHIQLNLSSVTECDSAGVQLLCALQRSVLEKGGELILINPTPCITAALNVLGIKNNFNIVSSSTEDKRN